MTEIALAAERENGYRPKRLKPCLLGTGVSMLALYLAGPAVGDFSRWFHGSAFPQTGSLLALAIVLGLLGVSLLLFLSALRGLPRLAAVRDGIELETLFGTKWANWNSLDAFELKRAHAGPVLRRAFSARARIVGAAVSGNLLGKSQLTLPDAFQTPLAAIVGELNMQRARSLGLSPAFAATPASEDEEARFGLAGFKIPFLTLGMLALLALVFIAEQIFAIEPTGPLLRVSSATRLALGGLSWRVVITNGEWYRLFTAPLLHGDATHLAGNAVALLMVGVLLERVVGRLWFFALFFISAIGGGLVSLAANPAAMVSIGASGAIMGLCAAAFLSSFRLPAGTASRSRMQIRAVLVLIPSLLPLAAGGAGDQIDYGAHLGGALSGTLAMFVLLEHWPDTSRLPAWGHAAANLAVIGFIVIAASAAAVAGNYGKYQVLAGLIPEDRVPTTEADAERDAASLATLFPQDPRAHLYLAANLASGHADAAAERELRTALKQAQDLRFFFLGPQLENAIRVVLAAVLLDEGRQPEAREAAQALCRAPEAERPPEELRKMLVDQHLCD